jgi:tetratricopeptide (TPR) repeat protein
MSRPKSASLALIISLCLGSPAYGQHRPGQTSTGTVDIHVYVRYTNEQPAGEQNQVDLVNEGGVTLVQAFTNSEGQAVLTIVGSGSFRARVSGPAIVTALSERINVDERDRSELVFVTVERRPDATPGTPSGSGGVTSANQLKVPAAARKSFDKAVDAMQHHDLQKSADLFQKAIDAYPQYDAAFDNLGVALMQMNQPDRAKAAFERAVQLNDKNVDANRNYSRLLIGSKQYAAAEEALKRALMMEPQDPSSLTLMCIAQFQTGDYDGALQSALKVHQVSHDGYAMAHYVAGRAYELKHEYPSAADQYQTYLKESPKGPQAEQVRAALAKIAAKTSASAQPAPAAQ